MVVDAKNNRSRMRDGSALEFCRLCREGRLFEVQAWLKEAKPAHYEHKNVRCTPLGIAIDRNFHSLMEVLLKHSFQPTPKHLWMAVRKGRAGMIELMLQAGADINWLDFKDVVCWPNPDVLRLLIERGADTKTGHPIADVLKRAPRAFLGLYKVFLDSHPEWQFQASVALRHFCEEGSMRGVSLLLWLKADPRAKVPEQAGDDENMWESALWQACTSGQVEIVKRIGPKPDLDDLDELLRLSCNSQNVQLVEYLIGLGANPNVAAGNGETALMSALWALEWRINFDNHEPYRWHGSLALLKRLIALGARLDPLNKNELSFLRRCLLKLDWLESYELIKFLDQHRFANAVVMTRLLKTPKMREHLGERLPALARIFPELKPWIARGTPGLTACWRRPTI